MEFLRSRNYRLARIATSNTLTFLIMASVIRSNSGPEVLEIDVKPHESVPTEVLPPLDCADVTPVPIFAEANTTDCAKRIGTLATALDIEPVCSYLDHAAQAAGKDYAGIMIDFRPSTDEHLRGFTYAISSGIDGDPRECTPAELALPAAIGAAVAH